jgi:hypothetical protein
MSLSQLYTRLIYTIINEERIELLLREVQHEEDLAVLLDAVDEGAEVLVRLDVERLRYYLEVLTGCDRVRLDRSLELVGLWLGIYIYIYPTYRLN